MLVNQSIISDLKAIIARSNDKAVHNIDHQGTLMYWHVGKRIFEGIQQSKDWADYGRFLVKYLSEHLQPEFGSDSSDFSMVNFTILFRLCMHCMHN